MRFSSFLSRVRPSSARTRSASRPRKHSCSLQLESLETRLAPACSSSVDYPFLHVVCDGADDTITVAGYTSEVSINVNGTLSRHRWVPGADVRISGVYIFGYGGKDHLTVESWPFRAPSHLIIPTQCPMGCPEPKDLHLNGGAGDDIIQVGAPTNGQLNHVSGTVQVRGGTEFDELIISDVGAISGTSFSVHPYSVSWVTGPSGSCTFGGNDVEAMSIAAGAYSDYFYVFEGSYSREFTLRGNGGTDTLIGPNATSTWNLRSIGFGDLNTWFKFIAVEYLQGGSGSDTFHFRHAGGLAVGYVPAFLNGGGGINTLSYAEFPTNVEVNLTLSTATNVAGGISGIRHVTGGSGNDILVGNSVSNNLYGGPGRDLLIGGAGSGSDTLGGGSGDDILIAGYTAYDSDPTALAAIRTEWTRPTDFSPRAIALYNGVGGVALNEGTVFHNQTSGNRLTGGLGLDWFLGNPRNYEFIDYDSLTEWFLRVY